MPASQTPLARLFREIKRAVDEQEMIKAELRKSRSKVNALLRKLDILTKRQRRGGRSKGDA